jgi:hypothetical protein
MGVTIVTVRTRRKLARHNLILSLPLPRLLCRTKLTMALTGEFEASNSETVIAAPGQDACRAKHRSTDARAFDPAPFHGQVGVASPSTHIENVSADGVLVQDISDEHDRAAWESWLCQACSEQESMEVLEIERAIKALEDIRQLNLELELQQSHNLRLSGERRMEMLATKCCTKCLLATEPGSRIQALNEMMIHVTSLLLKPCFTCGCPCCPTHQSKKALDCIVMCVDCEHLFTVQYVMDVLTAPASQRSTLVAQLLAVYDRNWLKFQLLSKKKDQVVESLQEAQVQRNHIHVGKSSVGIISGALGVAAAATSVAVPVVGTPLLVASLILGGGAAAVQTTTSIHHHMLFRPQQQAMQLMYTHAVLKSILRVVETLRGALVRDRLEPGLHGSTSLLANTKMELSTKGSDSKVEKLTMSDGCTVGRCSLVGVEIVVASRAATAAGSEAAAGSVMADVLQSSTSITRLAGGALAAVTLVLEAHSLASHVHEIGKGSPCSMAQRLLNMTAAFPSASRLNIECQTYLNQLSRRERCMTESEVHRALLQFLSPPTGTCSESMEPGPASPPPLQDDANSSPSPETSRPASRTRKARTSSLQQLRERIEVYTRQRPPSVTSVTTVDESDMSTASFDFDTDEAADNASVSSRSSLRARIERHKRRQHRQHQVVAS